MKKINAIFDKKVNVSEALEVLAGYVKWIWGMKHYFRWADALKGIFSHI